MKNPVTPLTYQLGVASRLGDVRDAKKLVRQGAAVDVCCRHKTGEFPIHIAARYGRAHIVEWLCKDMGVDVNVLKSGGETPLHVACKFKKWKVARMIARCGGNMAAVDDSGKTPMEIAEENKPVGAKSPNISPRRPEPSSSSGDSDTGLSFFDDAAVPLLVPEWTQERVDMRAFDDVDIFSETFFSEIPHFV